MRHPLNAVVLLTLLVGSVAQAQSSVSRGDVVGLEGTWALASGPGEPGPSERRVITVAGDRLTVVLHRENDAAPVTLIYRFDGAASETPFGSGTATARMRQESGQLLTMTVFTVNGAPVTVDEFLRVNAERTELTVERILRVEHGYQGVRPTLESKAPNVATAIKVFKRQ